MKTRKRTLCYLFDKLKPRTQLKTDFFHFNKLYLILQMVRALSKFLRNFIEKLKIYLFPVIKRTLYDLETH